MNKKQDKKVKSSRNKAEKIETKLDPPRQQPNHLQALKMLDFCVGEAPLSRQQHVQAQQALRQLSGAIGELEQLKKGKTR